MCGGIWNKPNNLVESLLAASAFANHFNCMGLGDLFVTAEKQNKTQET